MADYSINVPRLDWLIGGSRIGMSYNRYYGSCGTDSHKGFLTEKMFNYTVWMEKIEDTEYIRRLFITAVIIMKILPMRIRRKALIPLKRRALRK